MSRRTIVPAAECIVCTNAGFRSGAGMFALGYVAGMHRISRGDTANENLCVMHASEVDEAVARYVAKGIIA